MFNSFFAKQCSIIDNGSEIPSFLHPKTDKSLSNITFTEKDIEKVIQSLNGHDMISMRMLKICTKSIIKPLLIIYKKCLVKGYFPNEWKKANVVPAHKKNDKQLLKNYRPISLLPICGRVLERILYNSMFEFFNPNNLITPNQSGFKTGDSCINQLISITHEIYESFDDGYEVRGVFLDISKAFDKVWHQGLHYRLRQNGISGELLNILTDFLDNRTQRVILNGQYSSWAKVEVGVPQGSILGPLLFLIYINYLSDDLASNPKLFADDTALFSVVKNVDASNIELNNDLKKIGEWAFQWKMSFNPNLTKQAQELIFSRKVQTTNPPPLFFNKNVVPKTTLQKHLGMFLDSKLNFIEPFLPRAPLITIYKSFIWPHLDYGDMIYDQTFNMSFQQKTETIQDNAALAITGAI